MTNTKELPPETTPMQALDRKVRALMVAGVTLALVSTVCTLLVLYFLF